MSRITIGINRERYVKMEKNAYHGRKAAIEVGAKVYVGKPCKNCRIRIKRVDNGTCLFCAAQAQMKCRRVLDGATDIRKRAHDAEERALMKSFEL